MLVHGADETLKACSAASFQATEQLLADPGRHRYVPVVAGMSAVDAVLG